MIAVWAFCSILFAIIIHLLFHWETDIEILHAKWEAGDILTYVSTVALGLLAVWQNKRFKEENDVAQERLERLTAQANEISLVNKIIEVESDHLSRLRKALDEFTEACKPATLVNIYLSDDKTVAGAFEAAKHSVDVGGVIDNCYRAVLRELPPSAFSNELFIASFKAFHKAAGTFLEQVTKDPFPEDKYVEILRNEYKNFDIQKEDMLEREAQKLNRVIYESLTVAEIKKMYYDNSPETEEEDLWNT